MNGADESGDIKALYNDLFGKVNQARDWYKKVKPMASVMQKAVIPSKPKKEKKKKKAADEEEEDEDKP